MFQRSTTRVATTFLASYLSLNLSAPVFAGKTMQRAVTEADCLSAINKLKEPSASVVPGDNFPRQLRLAAAYYSLAHFYNVNKQYEKADEAYGQASTILVHESSKQGIDQYRVFADNTAKDYIDRGDMPKAKPYIDTAVQLGRTAKNDRQLLADALGTLADWYQRQKQWTKAEAALAEAIEVSGKFAYPSQLQLIDVYIAERQFQEAEHLIAQASLSDYADSALQFRRAQLLKALGKVAESNKQEEQAKLQHQKEMARSRTLQ